MMAFALAYTTWIFYLAAMSLIRARDVGSLPKPALVLGYPIVMFGVLCDFLLNVTVGSVLFMELPREWLLSPRLSRLVRTDDGWRGDLAAWVCDNLLNNFDPSGKHCK